VGVLQEYERSLEVDPENTDTLFSRALDYAAAGEPRKAIADYSRLIELKPDEYLYYSYRGDLYAGLGESEAALADYREALERADNTITRRALKRQIDSLK
jgi:tetratricopeptide (TPR) repeat protein